MNRAVFTLCMCVGIASLAWADDSTGEVKSASVMNDAAMKNANLLMPADQSLPTTHYVLAHTILAGMVKSVSWADPSKGTRSEIVVMDAARKPVRILVTSTTTLWDSDAKAILQDRVVTRSHINVIYLTTPEGLNVAKSIKVLK